MHQRCGLKRLTGRFIRHPVRRQFAQLLIHQREQFVGGVRIAVLDGGEDLSDVAHGGRDSSFFLLAPEDQATYTARLCQRASRQLGREDDGRIARVGWRAQNTAGAMVGQPLAERRPPIGWERVAAGRVRVGMVQDCEVRSLISEVLPRLCDFDCQPVQQPAL